MKQIKSGFSLIEMMIASTVMGLLAVVATPMYTQFRGRAIMASAKTNLSRVYAAEEGFYATHNTYHGNWPAIGFQLEHRGLSGDQNFITYADRQQSKDYYAIWGTKNCSDLGDGLYPVRLSDLGLPVPDYGAAPRGFFGGYWASPRLCPISSNSCLHINENYEILRSTFLIQAMGCPVRLVTSTDTDCFIKANHDSWTIDQNRTIRQITVTVPGC